MADKGYLTVNRAGINQYNPILEGVRKEFVFEFGQALQSISGYVDNETPADANAMTFQQVSATEYRVDFIAGTAPFDFVDELSYMRIVATSANGVTEFEKAFYIASQPTYPVQVYNYEAQAWQNGLADYSQKVVEVCGLKLLDTYDDEFGFNTFGGYKLVSIYDGGTQEGDSSEIYVQRQINQPIEEIQQALLVKHSTGVEEQHWIRFWFKNDAADTGGFTADIKIVSVACFGFIIHDPYIIEILP